MPRLYSELASWWPVMSDPSEYAEDAALCWSVIEDAALRPIRTLLELGCGGGNTARHLKAHYELTLSDVSEDMLGVSRTLNPECDHVQGDLRRLRLGRTFDAVLVHDAIMYMTSEDDLRAAFATAFGHCAPGGVALFLPDDTKESWQADCQHGGRDAGARAMRFLEWNHDPDPGDTRFICDFAFLLREADGKVRVEHDRHELGLFPRAVWLRGLEEAGFRPSARPLVHSTLDPARGRELFVGVRP